MPYGALGELSLGETIMGDDYRPWGLKDVERLGDLMAIELAWLRDLRHSSTESIANEQARTRELSEAMLKFNNERLARNGGSLWFAEQARPLGLFDSLTVVESSFIDAVLESAIPAFGSGVSRKGLDGRYWLPSQRDAWGIIEWSLVNTIPWTAEQYDCDDHAEDLRHDFRKFGINACLLVIDYSGGHAYNLIPFADGQYWFIESQADRIVAIGAGSYKLTSGYIYG